MRSKLVLVGLVAVAACKGQGPDTPGAVATAAPAGSSITTASQHSFVTPTVAKTYQAQGAVQSYGYTYTEVLGYQKDIVRDAAGKPVLDDNGFPTRARDDTTRTLLDAGHGKQIYSGNAATVRDPKISVTYDPRNAQYTLIIGQDSVSQNAQFQDPAHRTDFSGARTPQAGVPNLETATTWREKGVQYLEADNGSDGKTTDRITFFYELPGTSTKYVTYAGYVRNRAEAPEEATLDETDTTVVTQATSRKLLERATFVFGEQTAISAVPTTGTASYSGAMIASVVDNPNFENGDSTYFQWMAGTANVAVDFGTGAVSTKLAGTTMAPMIDPSPILSPTAGTPDTPFTIPAGATFAATSSARIDLANTGGFTGTFADATFTAAGVAQKVDIVGSSLDGAFYGPKADEVGASFRIVGGIPDQRVDIIGSFVGKQ